MSLARTSPVSSSRPAADATLALHGVSKQWPNGDDIADITMAVPAATYVVISGESGSGKTTLLRAIAGLTDIDSGRITLDGYDLTSLPPHQRPVSTVFQQYALFPHRTVAGNIAFGLEQQSRDRSEIDGRVAEMLELVGLPGTGERMPSSLSGGQQQRVALARALAVRPHVVLLDEPLGALDASLRQSMRRDLKRVQRESRVIFLHVSHDRDEALTLADHLVVMHRGRILAQGSPHELRRDPHHARVAAMVGLDNVVTDEHHTGSLLAFAPEHVLLDEEGWRGTITNQHVMGGSIEREIMLADGQRIRQRCVFDSETPTVQPGDHVGVTVVAGQTRRVKAG